MRVRHPLPPADSFDQAVSYLDGAIGDLLAAKLLLAPVVRKWEAPSHALQCALGDDPEAVRGARHLREVEARLREMVGADFEGHFDEFHREINQQVERAVEVGWLVGVEMACRRAVEA